MRVVGSITQQRVMTVDSNTGRVLAVPLHSRDTFTVRDGRTRRFISEFISEHSIVKFILSVASLQQFIPKELAVWCANLI